MRPTRTPSGPRTPVSGAPRRTQRQIRGARAEALVANALGAAGWRVVATNLRLGRDEVDLVAVDPGPPAVLVVVEVRSATSSAFGSPEERMDSAKVAALYRSLAALRRPGAWAAQNGLARLAGRVDLVVVDARSGRTELRHIRGLLPP